MIVAQRQGRSPNHGENWVSRVETCDEGQAAAAEEGLKESGRTGFICRRGEAPSRDWGLWTKADLQAGYSSRETI